MIDAVLQLLPMAKQALLAGIVTFFRVGAILALLPAFGERSVPQRVRLALAIAFTLIVSPAVEARLSVTQVAFSPAMLGGEVIAGLALGIILRLLVMVLQMAGQMAAQATSLSQIFGGATVDPQPAMSHLMVVAGLALAVMSGLHVRAAEAMILSYELLPPGQMPDASLLSEWGLAHIGRGFGLALTLAMPFVIASLIYNLALGVINRAMPQLMVSFVGAPAITLGGMLLLLFSAPMLLELWLGWMQSVVANPFEAPR